MSTILKIYKDNEVIAQQLVSLDNENDHNNDVYIKVQGLTPDTNYSEGAQLCGRLTMLNLAE